MTLDRTRDAKLQWWHGLRQLDHSEIPAAAKLAQQWEWDEIAIFTIAKVKQWDDIDLRFPLSYSDKIHENALRHNLDPVILFGLVRRESAFNKDAHSPVGARGLMQIMPKTARQISSDLNERWHGSNSLYDPVKNLRYGSYYYHKLLNQFNGHYALALAAYNAGPHRVKQWLPAESIPADIWIETIPFRETRNYVTSVLVYAMIYQQLVQSNQLSMNDFTQVVQPLTDVALNQ
jgi:soluble lytic murein transglycosylase